MKPSHILLATGFVALVAQVTAWLAAPVITQRYVRTTHELVLPLAGRQAARGAPGTYSENETPVVEGSGWTAKAQPGRVAEVLHSEEAR